MTPARLLEYAEALRAQRGPFPHLDPSELAAWIEGVAVAMAAPMEVEQLDAMPRKSGKGVIKLRGPADHVVANGRRGVLYRQVALVEVET